MATNIIPSRSQDNIADGPKPHIVGEWSDDTTKRQRIVWPQDSTDDVTNSKTENFLKELTQQTDIFSNKDSSNNPDYWLVDVTDSQVRIIKQNAGSYLLEVFPYKGFSEPSDMSRELIQVVFEEQC